MKHLCINPQCTEDMVYNYTHQTLVLLLLRLDHNNALKLGDGERVLRLYKFFSAYTLKSANAQSMP